MRGRAGAGQSDVLRAPAPEPPPTAEVLQKMGYTNVVSLEGGWRAWQEAGLPVE